MTREEAKELLLHILMTYEPKDQYGDYDDPEPYDQALTMAIEALCREQKEEDLAKDIARRMATIIENEQDMRVILKNASAEPTDLISRKELLDRIKAINSIPWGDDHGNAVKLVWSTEEVKRLIEKAPSADRPSGEWVEKEVMVDEDANITEWQSAKCSACGKYHTTPYMYYFDSFNYCPNCGAKMGGDAK